MSGRNPPPPPDSPPPPPPKTFTNKPPEGVQKPKPKEEDPTPVDNTPAKGGSKARALCKCIKSVRKTVKARPGSTKEQAAIAICVKSVLQKRGRTLKRFKCGRKPRVSTQRRIAKTKSGI